LSIKIASCCCCFVWPGAPAKPARWISTCTRNPGGSWLGTLLSKPILPARESTMNGEPGGTSR
jgi:hypothetical protein